MTPQEMLNKIGVRYSSYSEWVGDKPPRTQVFHDEKIVDLRINMSDTDWCNLCMRERDYYMGGCCGQLGYFQDTINGLFRDDGHITAKEFVDLVMQVESHEGFELFEREPGNIIERALKDYARLDPVEKLAAVWNIAKPALYWAGAVRSAIPNGDIREDKKEDKVWYSTWMLETSLRALSWAEIFSRDQPKTGQHAANDLTIEARILAHLKIVYDHYDNLEREPFSGFVILDDNGNVCRNGNGDCIFEAKDKAEEVLNLWRTNEGEAKEVELDKYQIVPCTVSLQEGLKVGE